MRPQLTLAGAVFPPSVNPCAASLPHDCDKPGMDVEYIMLALNAAGFSNFKFLMLSNANETISAISNRQADIAGSPVVGSLLNDAHLKDLLLVRFFVDPRLIMLTKAPAETSSVPEQFLILRILQWPVWVLLLLSYMIIRGMGEACKRYHFNTSKRAVYVAYALFLTIFTGAIGNLLAIALAKPVSPKKLFSNFDELLPRLDDKTCKLVIMSNWNPGNQINHSFDIGMDDSNILDTTIKRLESFNPVKFLPRNDQNAFAKYILHSKSCHVGITESELFLGGGKESCSLDVMQDRQLSLKNLHFHILLRKDHMYANEIQSALIRFSDQTQLKKKITEKYRDYVCLPSRDEGSSGEPSALTIAQMQDSFLLLVFGVILAGGARAIEFVVVRHACLRYTRSDVRGNRLSGEQVHF